MATIARIGPAHGLQTVPRISPVTSPAKKSVFREAGFIGNFELRRLKAASTFIVRAGIMKTNPSKRRMRAEILRSISVFTAIAEIKKEMAIVRIVKLMTIPSTVPKPLDLSREFDEERTIGRSGQMQGARMAAIPEINVKARDRGIYCRAFAKASSKSAFCHWLPERLIS